MKHTGKQPWDDIFDFEDYKTSAVTKIITRWVRNEFNKKEGF